MESDIFISQLMVMIIIIVQGSIWFGFFDLVVLRTMCMYIVVRLHRQVGIEPTMYVLCTQLPSSVDGTGH